MDYLKSIKKAVKRSVSDSILIDSLGGFFTYVDDSVYDSVLDTVLDSVEVSVNETMWGYKFCIESSGRIKHEFVDEPPEY